MYSTDIDILKLTTEHHDYVINLSKKIPSFSNLTSYILNMHRYMWPEYSLIAVESESHNPLGYVLAIPNSEMRYLFIWQFAVPEASNNLLPTSLKIIAHLTRIAKIKNYVELRFTVRKSSAHEKHIRRILSELQMNDIEPVGDSVFSSDSFGHQEHLFRVRLS